jgi:HSP20 family protein
MNLTPWRRRTGTLDVFRDVNREMEDVFRRFFREPFWGMELGETPAWTPRVDVESTNGEVTVKADLPGVDPKDIEVSLVGDVLVVKGHRKEEREKKDKQLHRIERFEGEFYREIPLPAGCDADRIEATSKEGVLTVKIPQANNANVKKIEVKAT